MKTFILAAVASLLITMSVARADYIGTVSGVKHFPGGAVAIDLDGKYPDQKMTLYIRASNVAKFTALPHEGDAIKATGPETLYHGRPEIVLRDPNQLSIAK